MLHYSVQNDELRGHCEESQKAG